MVTAHAIGFVARASHVPPGVNRLSQVTKHTWPSPAPFTTVAPPKVGSVVVLAELTGQKLVLLLSDLRQLLPGFLQLPLLPQHLLLGGDDLTGWNERRSEEEKTPFLSKIKKNVSLILA